MQVDEKINNIFSAAFTMQEMTENSFNTNTFPNSTEHALVTYNLSLSTTSAVQLVHNTSSVSSKDYGVSILHFICFLALLYMKKLKFYVTNAFVNEL